MDNEIKDNVAIRFQEVKAEDSQLRIVLANSAHQALLTAHYSVDILDSTNEASPLQLAQLAVEHADALIKALRETK